MPRWPLPLLLKLSAESRVAIGGACATADAFLPSRDGMPLIFVARMQPRALSRAGMARRGRPASTRRRLSS